VSYVFIFLSRHLVGFSITDEQATNTGYAVNVA